MIDLDFKRQWDSVFGRGSANLPTTREIRMEKNEPPGIKVTEPCTPVAYSPQIDPMDIAYMFSPVVAQDVDADSISQYRKNSMEGGKSLKSQKSGFLRRYAGVLFALFATFIYSLGSLIIKVFSDYHPFTVSIWRFQGMILPSVPILLYHIYGRRESVFSTVWPLTERKNLKSVLFITLRSLVGCTSSVLQIFALHYLAMADTSVIVYSSPVFVLFVAHIFLGEKAGYFSIVLAIITLGGVVVIARPPMLTGQAMDTDSVIGIAFALGSMLTSTLVYVILRHLREVHYAVVTLGYGIQGSIECAILAVACGVFELPHTAEEWGLLAALVIFTWGGQTALILALQLEQAGIVSLICSLDTCFAFMLQFIFLGVVPDIFSLIGSLIVVLGVLLSTFRKWVSTLPDNHASKLRYGFLLK